MSEYFLCRCYHEILDLDARNIQIEQKIVFVPQK